jgi:hypothetical protein
MTGALMTDVPSNLTALSRGVTDFARDAAYVVVGLGVMGFQRAQVRRMALQRKVTHDLALDRRVEDLRDGASKGRARIDDLAVTAAQLVGTRLQPIEQKLPATVSTVTAAVRDQARGVRIQIHRRPRP